MKRKRITVGAIYKLKDSPEPYLVRVHAADSFQNQIQLCNLGGGFSRTFSFEEFDKTYFPASESEIDEFSKPTYGLFYFEPDPDRDCAPNRSTWCWPGYASCHRWNGWHDPYFAKSVINAMFKHWYEPTSTYSRIYWKGDQGFYFDHNENEIFELDTMHHESVLLYSVSGLCWDRLDPRDDLTTDEARMLMPWSATLDRAVDDKSNMSGHELWDEYQRMYGQQKPFRGRSAGWVFRNHMGSLSEFQKQYVRNLMYRQEHQDGK